MKRYIRSDIIDVNDEDMSARKDAAKNPNARPATLARLAHDPEWYVRISVAENPNTPVDTLYELSEDNDPIMMDRVQQAVACNPNAPADLLVKMSHTTAEHVLAAIAGNPNTPVDLLTELSTYVGRIDDYLVRYNVAANPNTPLDVLKVLSNDKKESVSHAAMGTIRKVYGREALY